MRSSKSGVNGRRSLEEQSIGGKRVANTRYWNHAERIAPETRNHNSGSNRTRARSADESTDRSLCDAHDTLHFIESQSRQVRNVDTDVQDNQKQYSNRQSSR